MPDEQKTESVNEGGSGLLLPGIAFAVWLVVAAVVGVTLLRLAWKVFLFAWS